MPDDALPTASSVADWAVAHAVTPSPLTPLGVKGIGEAGPIGVPPTLAGAVLDARAPPGIADLHPPLHAETPWRAIREADPAPAGA
jgi:carbon-monoxide dehydrogenase large subunit